MPFASEPSFVLSGYDVDETTTVIAVSGEIHVSTAPRFSKRLTEAVAEGKTRLVLDMTGVTFIDSTGLSVLLNALRRVTRKRGRLVLACANPTVLRLFQITRLDSTFDIQPTVKAALKRLEGQDAGGRTAGDP